LHPEQEAQQLSDAQQPARAAFAVAARPSAMTAIKNTTLNFFMIFLLCIWKELLCGGWNIRAKKLVGLAAASRCGERALGEERLFRRAKRLARLFYGWQKAKRKDGTPTASTQPQTRDPAKGIPGLASESA
jgi:hypothetical protein